MSAPAPNHPLASLAKGNASHPPASLETGIDNFLHLMQRELVGPLKKVAELAQRIEDLRRAGHVPATLAGEQVFAELAETSGHSAHIAARLIGLGELLTGQPILADERVLLADVLRGACAELAELARQRRVGVLLDDGSQLLAPVYGSRQWLILASRHLLERLIESAPAGTHVLARLHQVGFHQLITIGASHNRPPPSAIDLTRTSRPSLRSELASAHHADALDMTLARAIVELHGGTLRSSEDEALEQFVISLPTGEAQAQRLRPNCTECPFMRQAEQFAEDIGELLNAQAASSERNPS